MVQARLQGAKIAGLASAIPDTIEDLDTLSKRFDHQDVRKISDSSGVISRPVVPPDGLLCTSDLCAAAAETLLAQMGWERDSIDGLIFVSQTPDYLLPATACVLQARLGLSKKTAALDINLGCSGYVYGLWLATQMVASGGCSRVLLLVGDTISRIASPFDRSVAPLFGDAGTATAIERDASAEPMYFCLGTDGNGKRNLLVPAGGFRRRHEVGARDRSISENGNMRSAEDLYMNGGEIFNFTLREVPPLVQSAREGAGWGMEDVDAYVFHQANKFMLLHLAKKMKLPSDKVVVALENFGNTSSASIPLAMSHALADRLRSRKLRLMLVGFGVGYSWAAASLTCGLMTIPDILTVSTNKASYDANLQST